MIAEVGRIFHALSDPSRLRLMHLLMASREPLNQSLLAESAGLSQANTSKHLGCLVQAGLVTREKEGQQVFFRVASPMVREVCGLVKAHVMNRTKSTYMSLR